ncbi:retrovirus-related pol polyprotein from transposon TNT 1-94, partial [Tanacetum coccineum]
IFERSDKFVRDFKSLAKEADESLAKHKALELEIERLLRAVVSHDIMSIVQNPSVVDTSDLQTELDRMKERFKNCIIKKENEYAKLWNDWYQKCEECKYDKLSYDKAYNDMQQKIKQLQAQLGDQKGKSNDTPCVSDTLDHLSQKLENKNMELEFQILNYAKENAYLKTIYKNLFNYIFVSEQKDTTKGTSANTKFANQSNLGKPFVQPLRNHFVVRKPNAFQTERPKRVPPKVAESNDLLTSGTSNSVPTTKESKVMENDKVISPGMFRIDPRKTYREDKFVPINKVRASVRTNPINVSQPNVITKEHVNSDSSGLSSTGVDNTAKTRRPQSRSNTKNNRVLSASLSSCIKNKEVEVEEHHRNLLLSKNKKHMSSECKNIKLSIWNDKFEVVCAMRKQCLITANHDVCVLNYVNGMNSSSKKQKENVSNTENQKKQKLTVKKPKKIGSKERLASPTPSKPRTFLRWSPTRRIFYLKGKIITSSELECQSDCSNGDNACTSNPQEPKIKRFPNSTSFLGSLSKFVYGTVRFGNDHVAAILGYSDLQWENILITRVYFVEGLRYNLFLVHFLKSKDEAPEVIKIFLKKITVLLQAPVISVRTDNDIEFKNQVLKENFNSVGISHQTSSVRTPQQIGIMEQRNRTLVEVVRTMLIFSRALLFLWAEAIATACYTQNRSIIHRRFSKTPYELINGIKLDISFLHVFGALYYPNNDREDIGKLGAKGLDLTYAPSTITTQQPTKRELDLLFEAMYDDYIGGLPSAATRTALNHFFKGTIDPTLFIRRFDDDILMVQVYFDDIFFGSTNPRYTQLFFDLMKSRFEMSMMGEMTFFLGLQVNQSPCGVFINQSNYVLEIFKKYGMETCDPVGTLMEIKDKLDLDQNGTLVDATKYRSMIGALMYLTSSRPDIVHATCLCARYQAKPTEKHLKEVKRIFRYLRGTVNMGLWYTKDSGFQLTGFSYAYAGCKDTFKSTSGGTQFLGKKLVSWSSKKQDCTVLSTAKAEYVSLSACCAQVIWMRTQLTDYGFHFNKIPIYCDSKSAIAISCNPVQHSRTKHIAVRYHFIKEHVEKGTIELYFVKTDYQLADLFTKALLVDRFNYLVRRLGMRSLSPQELERLAKSR